MSKVKTYTPERLALTRTAMQKHFQTLTPQEQQDNQHILQELDEAQTIVDMYRIMNQVWDLTATAKQVKQRKEQEQLQKQNK
ncbi:hypothetical protein HX127_08910 [Acinetobacter sp. 256-1]|uniref:hypothetical protein n=1 Tax=Acinetobacter sp. 256-1 TaxID=2746721 RepID=UPI002578C101|nr:hypothetical protein [Acinetobacter sp. 256-1]MDM1757685.1 hypothetical protein [Acinetobacter sp. 256-1]